MPNNFILSIIIMFLLISDHQKVSGQPDGIKFFFSGHCYQNNSMGDKVDYRLESYDFSNYEGVWLGGDVCIEALLNYSTVQYIDSIFDLGNPETHWALGNHDARTGNWEWYEAFTGRKTYYAYSSHGLTRIIMNSNIVPTYCEMLDEQFDIIKSVCDTINISTQLVLLMHHGLWRDVPDLPNPITWAQSDLVYWNANCDSVNTQFVDVIYPLLVKVKQRGIDVTCIMGDMGSQLKSFDMFSVDSIRFMGCGLYYNEPDNQVLIIEQDTINAPWKFTFNNLDSLVNIQSSY